MMECEDILDNNKTSICIHCGSPVRPSNNNKDNNNPFPHSSPSLSNSTHYVTKALSSIFKLNFLKPFDTLDWPQTNEQLSLLCIKCNDVLADLYHLYQDFLQLGQIDSFLSKKLERLDEIIDCHERQTINCDLITIKKTEIHKNKDNVCDDSPLLPVTAPSHRKLCPKELSIVVTPLSANEVMSTRTTTQVTAEEEEFVDSSSEEDNDDDDDYNTGWLDEVKMEEEADDDEFNTPKIKLKAMEEIIDPEHHKETFSQSRAKNLQDTPGDSYGTRRRKQNLRSSSTSTPSSSSSSTTRNSLSTSSKAKGMNKVDHDRRANNNINKNTGGPNPHKMSRYLLFKQEFPNPCWYCKRTDFQTPADCFQHTIAEHFPKTKHNTMDTSTVCTRCSKICDTDNSLVEHLKLCEAIPSGVVSTNGRFQCPVCSKVLARMDRLKNHMAQHSNERPFPCDQCQFQAKTSSSLRQHKNRYHESGNERVTCDVCQRDFKNHSILKSHKKQMHTAEGYRKYREQEKIFGAKRREKKLKITGMEAPSCTFCVDCNVDLLSRLGLFNHRRSVHGDLLGRNFTCDICGTTLKTKFGLDNHIKTVHSDARPFICESCGKSFKKRSNLNSHFDQTHTEEGRLRSDNSNAFTQFDWYNEQTREKNRRRKLLANQLALKLRVGQLGHIGGESSNSNV